LIHFVNFNGELLLPTKILLRFRDIIGIERAGHYSKIGEDPAFIHDSKVCVTQTDAIPLIIED
jgi:hypothetical protein